MIEDVEGIYTKFEVKPFKQLRILLSGKIDVCKSRSGHCVSLDIADSGVDDGCSRCRLRCLYLQAASCRNCQSRPDRADSRVRNERDIGNSRLRLMRGDWTNLVGPDGTGKAVVVCAACKYVDGVSGLVLDDRRKLIARD